MPAMVPGLVCMRRCISNSSRLREGRSASTMFQGAISRGMSPFTLTGYKAAPANTHIPGLSCTWLRTPLALRPAGSGFRRGTSVSAPSRLSCSASDASAADTSGEKKRLVFLGTPEVAAGVLKDLWEFSQQPTSGVEVTAAVTQPPTSRGRGRKKNELTPSPVAQMALDLGMPEARVLSPASAKEDGFLATLQSLRPHLCITAAYGNFLPSKFLSIPERGTVNIHPSLLPLYRGASPVQRALEDGVAETGVTVAFTVLAMDAGPIIAQHRVPVDGSIKAPELLSSLFTVGTELLIAKLPSILHGTPPLETSPQDDTQATHAAKVSSEEGILDYSLSAAQLHNKVRAFTGWPGTRTTFHVLSPKAELTGEGAATAVAVEIDPALLSPVDLKVVTTRVGAYRGSAHQGYDGEGGLGAVLVCQGKPLVPVTLAATGDALEIPCSDGSTLQVLELQPPGKKVMPAKAFWNGLQGRWLFRL